MIDEIRQIVIFVKTIEHGSFRGAAQELKLSPSVVSHHIAQLEAKLGHALIYRSTRRLNLTREGQTLLTHAQTMMETMQAGIDTLRGQSNNPSGELRITLPSVLSQSHILSDLAQFAKEHPKISMQLDFSDERQNIIKEGYDLAIRMSPARKRAQNRQTLSKSQRIIVAAHSYINSRDPIVKPEDIKTHDWLEFTPARSIKTVLRKNSKKAPVATQNAQISTNDASAVLQLAIAGAGLAIIPDFLAKTHLDSGKVKQLYPDWELDTLDIYAEWPANAPQKGIARYLVNYLADLAR